MGKTIVEESDVGRLARKAFYSTCIWFGVNSAFFFVAGNANCKSLCRSVGRLVGRLVGCSVCPTLLFLLL